jgi:hypothetical protein
VEFREWNYAYEISVLSVCVLFPALKLVERFLFLKLCTDIIPLDFTPMFYFLVTCNWLQEHGGRTNS